MKRRTFLAACVAILLTSCADYDGEVLREGIPPRPDLSQWPAEFQTRVVRDESRVRSGQEALTALGDLASIYHANGFYPAAARCYQALLTTDPENPRWTHRLASLLAGLGQLDDAVPLLNRTIELDPDYLPSRIRLGDIQLKLNQPAGARAAYNRVLERDPNNPHALLGLARIDLLDENWESARRKLEQAGAHSDGRIGSDLLVTVYQKTGQTARANALRSRAQASGSFTDIDDPWIDGLLDDCYDAYRLASAAGIAELGGDTATAIRRLERAIAVAPEGTTARFQLGTLHAAKGDFTKARTLFEHCTRVAPDLADGWAQLASVLLKVGRGNEANRVIAQGLEHCPDSPGLHLLWAQRLHDAGDWEHAEAEFRKVIRLRPEEAEPYVKLASLLFSTGRMSDGRRELERAIATEPQNPVALSTLAFHAISTGDADAATRWMTEVRNQPRILPAERNALAAAFQRRFGRPSP